MKLKIKNTLLFSLNSYRRNVIDYVRSEEKERDACVRWNEIVD